MSPFSEHKDRNEVLGDGEGRENVEGVIGTIIREARMSREVTQESLAQAIGRSRTTVVNIEGGVQGVTLSALYDIAFALDLSVYDLLPDDPSGRSTSIWEDLNAARQEIRDLRRRLTRAKEVLDG